jgi:putative ABC transport system permease protein
MILLFVMKENSYDKFNENYDRIYRLSAKNDITDYQTAQIAVDNFSQVEKVCAMARYFSKEWIIYNNKASLINGQISTDNSFFQIYSTQFIYGSKEKALPDINSCILTESSWKKIFGDENPIGKVIIRGNISGTELIVKGVIKDFPDNSSFKADILVNIENKKFHNTFYTDPENPGTVLHPCEVYLLLKKGEEGIRTSENFRRHAEVFYPYAKNPGLDPLSDMHLEYSTMNLGDSLSVNFTSYKFIIDIGVIILILAIINYVNLTAAQQNKRNKETGIRKTVGASRKDMIILFLTESVLVSYIAFFIALALMELFIPTFSRLIDEKLDSSLLLDFPVYLFLPLGILIIGVIAGLIPALILSSFNPIRMFSGGISGKQKKSYWRNALTVFQFAVSICLIFCIIVIQRQMNILKYKNLGFNTDQTMFISIPRLDRADSLRIPALMDKLRQHPNIAGVSGTVHYIPGDIPVGNSQEIAYLYTDSAFLKTFAIPLVKGRDFLPGDKEAACLINEAAYKKLGWNNLDSKVINASYDKAPYQVVGVVKDFNFSSLYQDIAPLCIVYTKSRATVINLRITPKNALQTMDYIKEVWNELMPLYPMEYQFYDEWLDARYRGLEYFGGLINLFGTLAIVISCLGILGLAVFSSERRAKEIGIRKVHGASIPELMYMLNKDFIKWVMFAFIIAAPIGYYFMQSWLEDFAYKTEINWLVFFFSGFFALAVALFTINWQIWRSATRNPVEVLKYE